MNLTKSERETIIIFNEAEPTAEITTASPKWKKDLDKLTHENAGVERLSNDKVFSTYVLPKKMIKVHKRRFYTEGTRVKMASALASAREKRNQTKNEAADDEKSNKKRG